MPELKPETIRQRIDPQFKEFRSPLRNYWQEISVTRFRFPPVGVGADGTQITISNASSTDDLYKSDFNIIDDTFTHVMPVFAGPPKSLQFRADVADNSTFFTIGQLAVVKKIEGSLAKWRVEVWEGPNNITPTWRDDMIHVFYGYSYIAPCSFSTAAKRLNFFDMPYGYYKETWETGRSDFGHVRFVFEFDMTVNNA